MIVWRISNYKSLDGQGGLFASGRWHKAERRIVYTSDHPASALLELIVHLDPLAKPKFCQLLKIYIPESVATLGTPPLPNTWQNTSSVTQDIGNLWLDRNATAVFKVPSAIVPESTNYLINPLHADASKISIESIQTVPLDERLS
jgi:RES domain-containing protein